jgi:hypothetical protein
VNFAATLFGKGLLFGKKTFHKDQPQQADSVNLCRQNQTDTYKSCKRRRSVPKQ